MLTSKMGTERRWLIKRNAKPGVEPIYPIDPHTGIRDPSLLFLAKKASGGKSVTTGEESGDESDTESDSE